MARRRRKGNPLLVRIILISIGVHILVLPILAYFGAFKNVGGIFHRPVDITLAPPPPVKDKDLAKKETKKPQRVAAKGAGAKRSGGAKGKPLSQHVVAANSPSGSGGNGGGPEIINPDKGAAPGTLPTTPTPTNSNKTGNGGGPTTTEPATKPATSQPDTKPKEQVATTTPVVKPHVPVVTEVAATYSPQPDIPEDLRDADLDTKVTAQVMVSAEGTATEVKITQSSGNSELDTLAADTAKKWRFKPATKDGVPVESRVNLHIEFQVQ